MANTKKSVQKSSTRCCSSKKSDNGVKACGSVKNSANKTSSRAKKTETVK